MDKNSAKTPDQAEPFLKYLLKLGDLVLYARKICRIFTPVFYVVKLQSVQYILEFTYMYRKYTYRISHFQVLV